MQQLGRRRTQHRAEAAASNTLECQLAAATCMTRRQPSIRCGRRLQHCHLHQLCLLLLTALPSAPVQQRVVAPFFHRWRCSQQQEQQQHHPPGRPVSEAITARFDRKRPQTRTGVAATATAAKWTRTLTACFGNATRVNASPVQPSRGQVSLPAAQQPLLEQQLTAARRLYAQVPVRAV